MTEFDERSAMEADVEALLAYADGVPRSDDGLFDPEPDGDSAAATE
jgi:hypothetical protein